MTKKAHANARSDDEITKRIKAEALKLNPESQLADERWSADTSADAVKARMVAGAARVAGLGRCRRG